MKTFSATLGNLDGANAGDQAITVTPLSNSVTIKDDDSGKGAVVELRAPVNASPEGTGTPGGNGSFTVGLTQGLVTDVDTEVTISLSGTASGPNSPSSPVDYDITTGQIPPFSSTAPTLIVTIPAGQNQIVSAGCSDSGCDDRVQRDGDSDDSVSLWRHHDSSDEQLVMQATDGNPATLDTVTVSIIDDDSGVVVPNRSFYRTRYQLGQHDHGICRCFATPVSGGTTIPQANVDTMQVVYTDSAGRNANPVAHRRYFSWWFCGCDPRYPDGIVRRYLFVYLPNACRRQV